MLYSSNAFFLILPFLIYICYTDIRYRKIHNITILILVITIFAHALFFQWLPNFQGALIAFVIGLLLFYLGGIGAGDIKFITVLILSVSNQYLIDFLILTAASSLPLIIIILVCYHLLHIGKKTIPYGVAISFGYSLLYLLVSSQY